EWGGGARGGRGSAPTAWGPQMPAGEVPTEAITGPWPVGRGTPNGFGLLDITTTVHEWCLDWYRADLESPVSEQTAESTDPADGRRSSRGGSWRHRVRWSSPAARS